MCLQSSTIRGLLGLLCANVSGLTINSYVDTYLMHKPGRCFTCGKRGHWADRCPDSQQSKISTFLSSFNIGLNLD
jgi:hypothetical protein